MAASGNPQKILILFFHPRYEDSKANKYIADRWQQLPDITFRDMYETYPFFDIDVQAEKALLLQHDIILFQHPFYWYSCPPLMKQWLDMVLEHGWAYGKGGDQLKGKKMIQVITSGGNFAVYHPEGSNRFTYREFLRPFEQTAYLCQMHYLPPYIVPGARKTAMADMDVHVRQLHHLLAQIQQPNADLPAWGDVDYLNQIPI